MESLLTPFLFQSAAQAITPILLAATAGVLCGRVGVFNLALEGQMLVGAFAAIAGSYFGHSALVGVAAAMVATAASPCRRLSECQCWAGPSLINRLSRGPPGC
jgi:ABC-type uncharacterized transport system permease subunit